MTLSWNPQLTVACPWGMCGSIILVINIWRVKQLPNYNDLTSDFSTAKWCRSDAHLVETVLQVWNLDFFLAHDMWSDLPFCRWAQAAPVVPGQPGGHEGKGPTHRQPSRT